MSWDRWHHILPLRLRTLFFRAAVERELDEELRDHLEHQVQQFVARGMSPERARTEAMLALGGLERRKDECRDTRGFNLLDHLRRDIRLSFRSLLRNPGYTAVALLTLALGIGATTAIFTVVNGVLLRPLDYRDPQRLVVLQYQRGGTMAAGNYFDYRAESRTLEAIGAAEWWSPNLTGGERAEEIQGLRITGDILPMLGVSPMLGRGFLPEEEHAGRSHVVVLSYDLWRQRFGSDAAVVGRDLLIDGETYQVVGVMPAGFRFAPYWSTGARLWSPLVLDDRKNDRGGASMRVFARLRPGVTLASARAEIAGIGARLEQAYPGTNRDATVVPLMDLVVGDVRDALLILFAAVGFVLLIACANVAHLQLLRAAAREREFALRGALGASRSRLVQQSLVESGMLALAGGAAGLVVAWAGVRLLLQLGPANLPRLETLTIDAPVLGFVLLIAAGATVLFGLAPALTAARTDLHGPLKEGSRGSADTPSHRRVRGLLVASEFALALMLLVAAGLVLRSFGARQSLDTGFDPRGVLSLMVSLRGTAHAERPRRAEFFQELIERVRAIPGAASVSATNHLPMHGDNWPFPFAIEGRPLAPPGTESRALFRIVRPGYFGAMGIPLLAGRDLTAQDLASAAQVILINQSMAERHWPGESPLGRRLSVDNPAARPVWFTVIGVVKDSRQSGWIDDMRDEMYFPHFAAEGQGSVISFLNPVSMTLVIRSASPPRDLLPAVQAAVQSLDRDAPVSDVITLEQAVDEQFAAPRFYLSLMGGFALLALILAAVGIYGVMSYSVARRSHEIGIRLALGADRRDAFRLVVGQGVRLAALGGVVGVIGALALSRFIQSLLFGVGPSDPLTFAAVAVLLTLVALVAAAIPARRAARVNPIVALRSE